MVEKFRKLEQVIENSDHPRCNNYNLFVFVLRTIFTVRFIVKDVLFSLFFVRINRSTPEIAENSGVKTGIRLKKNTNWSVSRNIQLQSVHHFKGFFILLKTS